MPIRRLMLASPWDRERLRLPVLGSSKIDGIRSAVQETRLLTRRLERVPNTYVQAQFEKPETEGFDGELTAGSPTDSNCMQNTQSAVLNRSSTTRVDFNVFDLIGVGTTPFIERHEELKSRVIRLNDPHVRLVEQHWLRTFSDIEDFLVAQLNLGYEGIMLRDPYSFYKNGRCTPIGQELLKVKLFEDAEAVVLDVIEMVHNHNERTQDAQGLAKRSKRQENLLPAGKLGKFIVRDLETGVIFKLSGRMSAKNREEWWLRRHELIGKIVTYKHFKITGVKIKPRQPIFKCFRHPLDLLKEAV